MADLTPENLPIRNKDTARYDRFLFLTLVVIELLSAIILSYRRYIPAQCDSLQYFQFQYYFLNAAATSGHSAQWIPYLTHGQIASWWYAFQASILQSSLMQIAPLLRHCNLLWCFHAGIFIDKMVLLCGMWLWCRRLSLSGMATFLASLCAVGSVVWMDQIYWNLHLYYALPLIFYFGHRFLDTGRWRYFIAAGNLLAVQMWGSLAYFAPVLTLVIAVYFSAFLMLNREQLIPLARRARWRWAIPSLIAVAIPLSLWYWFLKVGTSQIASVSEERMGDGSASLDVFLKYAGNHGFSKWLDVIIGLSPAADFTLYFGMVAAPLALMGIWAAFQKKQGALIVLSLFLFMFFSGTSLSAAAYFVWPGMRFFRHLALLAPLQKVLFCIFAGIGFDYLFRRNGKKAPRAVPIVIAVAMVGWSILLWTELNGRTSLGLFLPRQFVRMPLGPDLVLIDVPFVHFVASRAIVVALISAALIAFAATRRRPELCRPILVLFLLADVYQFQFTQTLMRGTPLSDKQASLTKPAELPFATQRVEFYDQGGERVDQWGPMARTQRTYYGTNNVFAFVDEAGHEYRIDFWLEPFDRLVRAFHAQDIDDHLLPPRYKMPYGGLKFPTEVVARRIAGIDAPKIQFFSDAYSVDSPREIAKLLPDAGFAGDLLFVQGKTPQTKSWNKTTPLSANERLEMNYRVTHFDSNDLDLVAENTTKAPCWLMYSDVWHPFWHATVNDQAVPVLCADLAYKAIPLTPGTNRVHFEFYSRAIDWIEKFQRLNSTLWVGIVLWLIYSISRRGTRQVLPDGTMNTQAN